MLDKADEEFIEAIDWYEEQQEGLAERFIKELYNLYHAILLNPIGYQKIRKGYRQAQMTVFPYVIVYSVDEKEKVISILSVFHTSRNPKSKFKTAR